MSSALLLNDMIIDVGWGVASTTRLALYTANTLSATKSRVLDRTFTLKKNRACSSGIEGRIQTLVRWKRNVNSI